VKARVSLAVDKSPPPVNWDVRSPTLSCELTRAFTRSRSRAFAHTKASPSQSWRAFQESVTRARGLTLFKIFNATGCFTALPSGYPSSSLRSAPNPSGPLWGQATIPPRPSGLGIPFGCTPRPTLPDWQREQAQRATPLTYSLATGSLASSGIKSSLRRHPRPFGARAKPCAPHAASGAALDPAFSQTPQSTHEALPSRAIYD